MTDGSVIKPYSVSDFAMDLTDGADPFERFQTFIECLGARGYFYGFVGMKSDLDEFDYSQVLYSHHTYGPKWDAICSGQPIDQDITIQLLLGGKTVVFWESDEVRDAIHTADQKRIYDAEIELGMLHGCSVMIEKSDFGASGLGLWVDTVSSEIEMKQFWDRHGDQIRQAAHILDARARRDRANSLICLTPRELESISWLVKGFRPQEICHRMSISEKTFEKHIANVKRKLKARTRDSAIAKAVLLRLV